MKKLLFVLAIAFVSVFVACQKEDDAPGGGGGSGLDRDKFLGQWTVNSHHSPSGQSLFWQMNIVAGASTNEIFLDNFDQMGAGNYVRANVSGNTFTIPTQTGPDSVIYNGSGSYSNSALSFNYTADDQANPIDNVNASATR
jgi:hypothetical protein